VPTDTDTIIEISPAVLDQLKARREPLDRDPLQRRWHPSTRWCPGPEATGCTLEKAVWITQEAHTMGRAWLHRTLEEGERVQASSEAIKLQVETDKA